MNLAPSQRTVMAAISTLATVIPQNEILIGLQIPNLCALVFWIIFECKNAICQVEFQQSLTVHVYVASIQGNRLSRQTRDALDRAVTAVISNNHDIAARLYVRGFGPDNILRVQRGPHAL